MSNDEGLDLGSSGLSGATFLTGPVMASLWDAGGATLLGAAKKKKAPAKKPTKKPKPKATKAGPGCFTATRRTQVTCTNPC
jgi:hypothetical protein